MAQVYKKPAQAVIVKLVSRHGESALIEWHDGKAMQRAYVPFSELRQPAGQRRRSNEYETILPELGAPHGLPWAELIKLSATPEAAEAALHQFGIWTVEDIERDHVQALAALQSLYARDLSALIRAARIYQTSNHSPEEES